VGLDIGTTKVCAIVGEVAEDGKVEIVGLGTAKSAGIRKGVVIDIDEAAAAIAEAVAAARAATNYDIHSVVVGVTGEHIASLNSRGVLAVTHPDREITAEDVDRVLDQAKVIVLPPDREIIHSIPRSYTIDGQSGIRYPVGMAGTRLEVETHVVTGAVTLLQNVAKAVGRASLSVEASVLEPIASSEAVVTPAERDLGVALVDIGGGTTDLAVFVDGDIGFSSIIPIGGNHVTRDISIGLRVTLEEAERIKLAHSAAAPSAAGPDEVLEFDITGIDGETRTISRRQLLDIVSPRIEEIFRHVRQEIEKSGYHNFLPAGIVLTGGGALMPASTTFCTEVTGLSTRTGSPSDIKDLPENLQSPVYATGLGLVLYAARYTRGNYGRKINPSPLAAQVTQKLGSVMQRLQKFFARVMGSE
jgi:cell division protein FtsA